jgi:hypothetical protein
MLALAVLLGSWPALRTGRTLAFDEDYFQYLSRHESVRKTVLEYRSFPFRAYWFGGGYPTLGDPEDPTLSPTVLLTLVFGPAFGLKLVVLSAILVGALGAYALGRWGLGFDRWASLVCGATFGLSAFVPLRVEDGNPNEVYAAFLPLFVLLVLRAVAGSGRAMLLLPIAFYTASADGKQCFLMGAFFVLTLCALQLFPGSAGLLAEPGDLRARARPLERAALGLVLTFGIGLARYLPALDVIELKGGLAHLDLATHTEVYSPDTVQAYTTGQLLAEMTRWQGYPGLATVGVVPLGLGLLGVIRRPRRGLPWAVAGALFAWLLMAHHAPVDLLALLWHVPPFNAVDRPYKYFSFEVVFACAVLAGLGLSTVHDVRRQWVRHGVGIAALLASAGPQLVDFTRIHARTYTFAVPPALLEPAREFYNVAAPGLVIDRREPLPAVTYVNLLRGIGTLDWYTCVPLPVWAAPRDFIDAAGRAHANPAYRGEVYAADGDSCRIAGWRFRPGEIAVDVVATRPCTVVINQNHDSDWTSEDGPVERRAGLLAVRVPEAGAHHLRLRYRPHAFFVGLCVSVLCVVVLLAAYRWVRDGAAARAAAGTGRTATMARLASWVIVGRAR